jgi:hypothetical protein
MSLPTTTNTATLDFVRYGLPFNKGVAKNGIVTNTLDLVYYGLPFAANDAEISGSETTDTLTLSDSAEFVITIDNTDSLTLSDTGTAGIPVDGGDSLTLSDSASFTIIIENTDSLTLHDVMLGDDGNVVDSETLTLTDVNVITVLDDSTFSLCIQIEQVVDDIDSLMIAGLPYSPAPVSDYTGGSNPFLPTIAIDGEYLISNAETVPDGGISNAQIYINLANPGLGTEQLCGLYSYSINLTLGGGTFSFLSENPIGSLGGILNIFGCQGTITATGPHCSSAGIGYITNGIFGSRNMNKQILLTLQNTALGGMAPGVVLQSPTSSQWTTVKAACKALCSAAEVAVGWGTHDAPLIDLFPQTGQTVRDAITALAAQVGGILVYTGTSYAVVDPVGGYGAIGLLPDCHLLAPGGIQAPKLLDMDSSILVFPVEGGSKNNVSLGAIASFDMSERSATLFPKKEKIVETVGSTSKRPKIDTPIYFDLPGQYNAVKARIRVSDPLLIGGIIVQDSDSPEVDPAWGTSPFTVVTRGNGKRQVMITNGSIPDTLNDGDFSLDIGYTRDTDAFDDAWQKDFDEQVARKRHLLEYQQHIIRYVPTQEGSINTVFFGQLPIPGMIGQATYGDISAFGMIESVSLTSPGYLSVQMRKYAETNFLAPRALLDYYAATGEPRP